MDADCFFLKWDFSPPNYFERNVVIEQENIKVTITFGVIEAKVIAETCDDDAWIARSTIQKLLETRFKGAQLICHKPYSLNFTGVKKINSDGTKTNIILCETGKFTIKGHPVDLSYTDANGKVFDSKQERIERKRRFSELSQKYYDDLCVALLLQSYEGAVRDPDNELSYLYQIKDCLCKLFVNEKKVPEILKISKQDWDDVKNHLGRHANNPEAMEGRHRGRSLGVIRRSTEEELQKARHSAVLLIEHYFTYLENRGNNR